MRNKTFYGDGLITIARELHQKQECITCKMHAFDKIYSCKWSREVCFKAWNVTYKRRTMLFLHTFKHQSRNRKWVKWMCNCFCSGSIFKHAERSRIDRRHSIFVSDIYNPIQYDANIVSSLYDTDTSKCSCLFGYTNHFRRVNRRKNYVNQDEICIRFTDIHLQIFMYAWPCSPWVLHSSVVYRASNRHLEGLGFDSRWGAQNIFLSISTWEHFFIYFKHSFLLYFLYELLMNVVSTRSYR